MKRRAGRSTPALRRRSRRSGATRAGSRCSFSAGTSEAAAVAATLGEGFPRDVADALRALAARRGDAYRAAVDSIRRSFETREDFLEDVPVPDTALALDALAARRGLG